MSGVKRWDHAVRWQGMKIAASYMAIKSGGKYVLASDYDRDTQALREDRDSQQRACIDVMTERDELRAILAQSHEVK